jgi:hypothetical protein
MRKLLVVLLILSSHKEVNAQSDETVISQILGDLLNCSSPFENDTVFFDQRIVNTFFNYDSISIEKKTRLQIPQKILSEIISNSREAKKENHWKEDQLNEKFMVISPKNDTTFLSRKPYIKCLSEKQLDSVSTLVPTLSVYSISRLVFDNNQQTATFELAYGKGGRYFSFESVIIKKIFGRWIIVQKFDWKIS